MAELCQARGARRLRARTPAVTADQFAARHIGQDTRLPSLELTTTGSAANVLANTDTIAAAGKEILRAVFQKLFGQGDTDKGTCDDSCRNRKYSRSRQGSGQKRFTGQASESAIAWSSADYLDSVREIERRVQMASQADTASLNIPDAPGWYAE